MDRGLAIGTHTLVLVWYGWPKDDQLQTGIYYLYYYYYYHQNYYYYYSMVMWFVLNFNSMWVVSLVIVTQVYYVVDTEVSIICNAKESYSGINIFRLILAFTGAGILPWQYYYILIGITGFSWEEVHWYRRLLTVPISIQPCYCL